MANGNGTSQGLYEWVAHVVRPTITVGFGIVLCYQELAMGGATQIIAGIFGVCVFWWFGERAVKGASNWLKDFQFKSAQAIVDGVKQITTINGSGTEKPASGLAEENPMLDIAEAEKPAIWIPSPDVRKPNAFEALPQDLVDTYKIDSWFNRGITNPPKMPVKIVVADDQTPDMAVSQYFTKQADDEVFKFSEFERVLRDTMCSEPQIHADVSSCWKVARDNWISYALALYYDK